MEISEILESFKINDRIYKRDEIDEAIRRKEEITPYLIKILERVLENPEEYTKVNGLMEHIYALLLLADMKSAESHKVIIDLFSLPGERPHELFCDIVTENLPEILIQTCNGSIEDIKKLVLNPNAEMFCRSGAMKAINYAVAAGYLTREEAFLIYRQLLENREQDQNPDFLSFVAGHLCDIYPVEMMDLIKECYEEGYIYPGITSLSEFNDVLNKGKEFCLDRLDRSYKRILEKDIHDTMSWWGRFDENKNISLFSRSPFEPPEAVKKIQKVKNKRKMIKASKKKNRKKKKKK
jgi:uncharacterized protein DUF1186